MTAGDLITGTYQVEYNGLLIGDGTKYDIESIDGLIGYDIRSDTVDRFGAHGGVAGRHYAHFKTFTVEGNLLANTDTEFRDRRQNLAAAYKPIVDPDGALPWLIMLPDPTSTIVKMMSRPLSLDCPLNRPFALKYAKFKLKLEAVDPVLYNRAPTSQSFTLPSDTRTIVNAGNAPAKWVGTLIGACQNPILTNNTTGQVISFYNLAMGVNDVLTFDSGTSTVMLNGTPTSGSLQTGFSWWDFSPGNNSISFIATNVSGATFNITTNDAYWMN